MVQSRVPLVADWFYSHREGQGGTLHASLLRCILYQLLDQDKSLFPTFAPFYRAGFSYVSCTEDCDPSAWCKSFSFAETVASEIRRVTSGGWQGNDDKLSEELGSLRRI